MDRKQTAWKKSRTFGDIYGGRKRRKIPDRIAYRAHSVKPPGPHDETPIFVTDNPSRDFYFPLSEQEIRHELSHLPRRDWSRITHVWLRRFKKIDYVSCELPLAEFICGSGVQLIVLYPWPKDLLMPMGANKPTASVLSYYEPYGPQLKQRDSHWCLQWEEAAVKNFCVEQLLYHEVGHHVDWYQRHWSRANRKIMEEFANQYAFERTSKRSITY